MLPAPWGKPRSLKCLVRLRRITHRSGRWLATRAILLFAILCGVVLPAFSVARLLLVLPSLAVLIGGSYFSAIILAFFASLESNAGETNPSRKRLLVGLSVALAIGGSVSLAVGIINGNALPQRQRLVVGHEIPIGREPVRVAEAPNGIVWIGDRSGEIQSIDASLRQPIGTPIQTGGTLDDLAFYRGFVFATVDGGKLDRLNTDPTVPRPLVSMRYGGDGGEIAAGRGSILVNDRSHARVYRFSTALKLTETFRVSANPKAEATAIAIGRGDFLWVIDAGLNVLYEVSLETGKVVMSKRIAVEPEALLVAGGVVYVAHPSLGFIEAFDEATGKLLPQRISIEAGQTKLSSTSDLLVVCNAQTDSVASVSLDTGKRIGSAVTVGAMPTDVDFGPHGGTTGWVANRDSGNVMPLIVKPSAQAKRER
jgi:hypothetical protein